MARNSRSPRMGTPHGGSHFVLWSKLKEQVQGREVLPQSHKKRDEALVIVLSVTLVAGMAIALLLILLWRSHPMGIADGTGFRVAVAVCPPFMLVRVVGGVDDTRLSILLTGSTIVIANGSLYAGLAAFVFWALSTFRPGRQPR